jgi:hypothetical protein
LANRNVKRGACTNERVVLLMWHDERGRVTRVIKFLFEPEQLKEGCGVSIVLYNNPGYVVYVAQVR